MKNKYIPDRHDVVWINFEPQTGREIAKRRPALVLSSKIYNRFGYALVCPLTTQIRNLAFEIPVKPAKGSKKPRAVLADQIKSFDWQRREAEFKEKLEPAVTKSVIQKIALLLTQ